MKLLNKFVSKEKTADKDIANIIGGIVVVLTLGIGYFKFLNY